MEGREAHPAGFAQVGVLVATGNLAQGGDEVEEPPVGAALEQYLVPGLVQLDRAVDLATGLLQTPRELGQALEPVRLEFSGQPEGQRLELGENSPDVPQLPPVERPHPKSSAGIGVQDAVVAEPLERLPHRRSTDAELGCEGGVADLRTRRKRPALDQPKELLIDLLAEWVTRDHRMFYFVYNIVNSTSNQVNLKKTVATF